VRHGFGLGASPQIEEATDKPSWSSLAPQGDEPEIQRVIGHIRLLDEAGLIRGVKSIHGGSDIPENIELTWKGHEFLNDVRDLVIWGKTKERAKAIAVSVWVTGSLETPPTSSESGELRTISAH